ncbi:MAG: hypothetical protein ABI540_10265 [Spartobacteria bacterium]
MKTNYWPFGFAVVAVSLILPWFDPVTTPRFNALNFPLARSAFLWPPHFLLLSYGTLILFLVILGVWAWLKNKGGVVFALGWIFVLLGMTFYLQITCWESTWLHAALIGGQDFERCYRFSVAYTIPNAVIASPAKGLFEPVEGVTDRFYAGTSALGVGWSFFLAGSIWVCGAGLAQMNNLARLKFLAPVMLATSLVFGLLQVWRPIIALRSLAAGEVAEAHGEFAKAKENILHAMRIDEWYRLNAGAYLQLGQLYSRMGLRDRPESHLSEAASLQQRGLVPEALAQFDQAASLSNSPLKQIALEEKSRLASHYAGTLYRQGAIGEASHYWQISIAAEPEWISGYFGVGRAKYDVAAYPDAIKYFESLLTKTSQSNLLSDTANYLGDCYYRIGEVEQARKWYIASRAFDDRANFRALKSLTESYYK